MAEKKKPSKPLNEYSTEKLREWMQKSLRQVDDAADPSAPFGQPGADRALKRMIKRLKEAFPAREWTAPSGVVWKGTELPQVVLTTVLREVDSNRVRGNMLNMAVELIGNDGPHMRWLLASGFNPNKFSQENKNTPVGGLAMRAKYVGLQACREAGYDLRAFIAKEHLSSIPADRQGMLLETNLLHRVARHCVKMKNKEAASRTIKELLLAGIDPRDKSAAGKSSLDMATGVAVEVLEKWIAHKQAQELDATTQAAVAPARTPRL